MPLQRYIHVTSSKVLPFLDSTNFKLKSLDSLLLEHGIAPLAGEIFDGGVRGITSVAETAFAKIDCRYWPFKDLIQNYGESRPFTPRYQSSTELKAELEQFCDKGFNNIKQLTIKLLRELQMGALPNISNEIKENVITFTLEQYILTMKSYIANYAIAKFLIETAPFILFSAEAEFYLSFIRQEFYTHLPLNFLDLSTDAQLEIIESIELPEFLSIQQFNSAEIETDKLLTYDYELYKEINSFNAANSLWSQNDFKDKVLQNKNKGYYPDLESIENQIRQSLQTLNQVVNLFIKTLRHECSLQLNDAQKQHIIESFPIVFVLDDNPQAADAKLSPLKKEFRSKNNLSIGSDIRFVATTPEHISTLKNYLNQQSRNVRVVSIEYLQANKGLDVYPRGQAPRFFDGGAGSADPDAMAVVSTLAI